MPEMIAPSIEDMLRLAQSPVREPAVAPALLPASYQQIMPDMLAQQTRDMLTAASPSYRQRYDGPPPVNSQSGFTPTQQPTLDPQQLTYLIRQAESSGNYGALNPHSSASGAYQYTDSTWNGYGGYAKAALAPPAVQDRRFQQDLHHSLKKYNGDVFKVIASHYLPAYADEPSLWEESLTIKGHHVEPIAKYVKHVLGGNKKLENAFDEYLADQQQNVASTSGGTGELRSNAPNREGQGG